MERMNQARMYKKILSWAITFIALFTVATIDFGVMLTPRTTGACTYLRREAGDHQATEHEVAVGEAIANDTVIFALIAFGKAVGTNIVERAYESLRGIGNYHGPILIVTNAQAGRYERDDDRQLFVHYKQVSLGIAKSTDEVKVKMAYKKFKTELIDIVDEMPTLPKHIQNIIYMDIDVCVGRDLQLFRKFIEESQRSIVNDQDFVENTRESSFIQLFPDNENKLTSEDFHSGVMVLHRQYSRQCLTDWRKWIESGEYSRDQPALAAVHRDENSSCAMHLLPKETFLLFPIEEDMKRGLSKTFVHVTNTNRAKKIDAKTQETYYHNTIGVQHTAVALF